MKHRLPRRYELIFFVVLAAVCAAIVGWSGKHDVGLAFAGAPIFLVGAMLGFRRSNEKRAGRE